MPETKTIGSDSYLVKSLHSQFDFSLPEWGIVLHHAYWLNKHICEIDLDDSTFSKLKDKIARLSARTAVFYSLQGPARQLRNSSSLPHAHGRLTRFLEVLYGGQTKASSAQERWQKIRGLSCETLLLIGVAYNPLEITKMGRIEFECLMDQAEPYLSSRPLPENWIFRREIQMAMATSSDLENISELRKRATLNPSS
ncbi:hypothetical protein MferCBS49748_006844 [Microsporum ferrugineum]